MLDQSINESWVYSIQRIEEECPIWNTSVKKLFGKILLELSIIFDKINHILYWELVYSLDIDVANIFKPEYLLLILKKSLKEVLIHLMNGRQIELSLYIQMLIEYIVQLTSSVRYLYISDLELNLAIRSFTWS